MKKEKRGGGGTDVVWKKLSGSVDVDILEKSDLVEGFLRGMENGWRREGLEKGWVSSAGGQ